MEQLPSIASDPPPSLREPFGIGSVLGKGFSIFFRNLPSFVLLSVLLYSPLLAYAMTTDPLNMTRGDLVVMTLVLVFGGMVLQYLLTAAVTYGVVEQMAGRHAGFGRSLFVGLRSVVPALGLFVAMIVLMLLGALALIVGFVVVMCMLYVAVPALVIEQRGIVAALKRSAYLTAGNRWHIFGIGFVLGIISRIGNFIVEHVLVRHIEVGGQSVIDPDQWTIYMGGMVGVMVAIGALGATMSAVAYVQLRNEKDGTDVRELAGVFE